MDPVVVSLVSACTALFASILAPFVTLRVARAQINANVLSGNRQKWIEALRELVAAFISQFAIAAILRDKMAAAGPEALAEDAALLQRLEQLIFTISKIRLMINPHEADHRQLYDMMERALTLLREAPPQHDFEKDLAAIVTPIADLAQGIFKREWMRVKRGE